MPTLPLTSPAVLLTVVLRDGRKLDLCITSAGTARFIAPDGFVDVDLAEGCEGRLRSGRPLALTRNDRSRVAITAGATRLGTGKLRLMAGLSVRAPALRARRAQQVAPIGSPAVRGKREPAYKEGVDGRVFPCSIKNLEACEFRAAKAHSRLARSASNRPIQLWVHHTRSGGLPRSAIPQALVSALAAAKRRFAGDTI